MIIIESMHEQDIAAVVHIEKLSFAAPKSENVFREDEHKYLVAKDDGKIVGYIGIEKIAGETHIINMAVHPLYRKLGIGKLLLEEVLNVCDTIFLEVRTSNINAISLYEKYGFKVIDIRKKYYQNNDEDALVMKRVNGEM